MAELRRATKRELIELIEKHNAALAIGRKKGAQVQRIGAALRQGLIDRAVGDLLANSETANWRTDAIVRFIFKRQGEIGLRPAYSRSSLDRRVRAALRKWRIARSSLSDPKNGKALAASSENRLQTECKSRCGALL